MKIGVSPFRSGRSCGLPTADSKARRGNGASAYFHSTLSPLTLNVGPYARGPGPLQEIRTRLFAQGSKGEIKALHQKCCVPTGRQPLKPIGTCCCVQVSILYFMSQCHDHETCRYGKWEKRWTHCMHTIGVTTVISPRWLLKNKWYFQGKDFIIFFKDSLGWCCFWQPYVIAVWLLWKGSVDNPRNWISIQKPKWEIARKQKG